jgi:hypothetical protein
VTMDSFPAPGGAAADLSNGAGSGFAAAVNDAGFEIKAAGLDEAANAAGANPRPRPKIRTGDAMSVIDRSEPRMAPYPHPLGTLVSDGTPDVRELTRLI